MGGDGFVVLVEFRLKPGTRDRFIEVAKADAEASVRDEPGCRRFDLLLLEDEPDMVWLYEIYADRAAFDAHLETPHLKRFQEDNQAFVEEVVIRRCMQIEHAKR